MDFIDQLQALSAKIPKLCDVLKTEEATKNALVMPFINILGYDIFDPTEVIPEFIADVGIKKGEKVDYAIVKDGKIIMLFECKHCGGDLHISHASQLFRYFAVTEARIAVLTNGVVYRFFTDLEAPNKMDEKPFLEVNMLELNDVLVAELKKLTKPAFNLSDLMTAAGDLKYTREIKRLLTEQMETPSDEFVRFFASKVFDGSLTPNRREYFSGITKLSFNQLINERINARLTSAMAGSAGVEASSVLPAPVVTKNASIEAAAPTGEDLIQTSEEELEGFFIVKALLRDMVDPKRIVHRDTQSYMGILLDDNNRKPLARLRFNRTQKYVGIFDEKRNEERVPIQNLNDIYQHADKLRRVFSFYEREDATSEDATT
ncbi:MAG: type I restriction endonuclease [Acidobacteriota bacterium]|nr:type I restriction endonuclease [Acidobacteriota bacterium]